MSISYAVFCLNAPAPPEPSLLPLPDALPIFLARPAVRPLQRPAGRDAEADTGAPRPPAFQLGAVGDRRGRRRVGLRDQRRRAERRIRPVGPRSEEHTSELQSHVNLVCRLLLECSRPPRTLPSSPTRRSSDLPAPPSRSATSATRRPGRRSRYRRPTPARLPAWRRRRSPRSAACWAA